jgi:hypothetical protein
VTPLLWLAGAVIAGAAAWAVGWPAWREYRRRESRDLNAERYLAWRGRAPRGRTASLSEGLTRAERRRLYLAAAFFALAVAFIVIFLIVS